MSRTTTLKNGSSQNNSLEFFDTKNTKMRRVDENMQKYLQMNAVEC